MNKSAIALAVAAALAASAAAQAETTLYGSIRAGITWTDPDSQTGTNDDNWVVKDESSRIGIKGSEDLGNGLSAIYQVEFGFNVTNDEALSSGREQWVGLGGGFGRVRFGNTESPFYMVEGRTDVFITSFRNYALMPNDRRNNALVYDLPGGLPIMGRAMLIMDGGGGPGNEDAVDEYSIGFNASFGGFGGGIAYVSDENADEDAFVVAASFDFAGASIGAQYHSGDFDDRGRSDCGNASGDGEDSDVLAVEAQYKLGATILRAGWNRCDPDNGDEADGYAFGFSHALSPRTLVALEYQDFENAVDPKDDQSEVAFHLRHSF